MLNFAVYTDYSRGCSDLGLFYRNSGAVWLRWAKPQKGPQVGGCVLGGIFLPNFLNVPRFCEESAYAKLSDVPMFPLPIYYTHLLSECSVLLSFSSGRETKCIVVAVIRLCSINREGGLWQGIRGEGRNRDEMREGRRDRGKIRRTAINIQSEG